MPSQPNLGKAADVAADLASRFFCRHGWYAAHTETGDEYIDFSVVSPEEAAACRIMLAAFNEYATRWRAENVGEPVLYWRYAPPHIFWHPEDSRLRCRLVLVPADKPIVFTRIEAYNEWREKDLRRRIEESLQNGQQQRQQPPISGRRDEGRPGEAAPSPCLRRQG